MALLLGAGGDDLGVLGFLGFLGFPWVLVWLVFGWFAVVFRHEALTFSGGDR
jgi:hypothetical protein